MQDQLVRRCRDAGIAVGTRATGHDVHRLGRCALPECHRVVADMSRNGRQRYCSHACANRDAVRRHRARKPRIR